MTLGNTLVTGGGGFLGKALVRKLVDKGETVFSFSRSRYSELDKLGVSQIQGDLTDAGAVANALKGMDTVFHTAAKPGIWGDYDEYFRINVTGTVHVIDACMKNKVGQLIHTSSPSVVFDDKDMHGANEFVPYPDKYLAPYPETKALAEKEVIKAAGKGLSVIILRPHLIWGPEDNHLLPGIISRASRLKIIGPDNDLVDTIYVDNAADAHILAAEKLSQNLICQETYILSARMRPYPNGPLPMLFWLPQVCRPSKGMCPGTPPMLRVGSLNLFTEPLVLKGTRP